jgi:hypothetical protein
MADLDLNFVASDVLDARITFSRTSLGTYYDSAGVLKYAAHNLILQSQDFNTTWTKSGGATVTVDAIAAPDSTTTADKFNHVTAGTVTSGQVAATPGYTHAAIVSVYAKAGTKNWLAISCLANGSAIYHCYFDLSSGVVGAVGSQWTSSGIQNVGNGWYRCWALTKAGIGGSGCILYMAEASGSVQMTSPGDIYIWGAQAEQVTTATTPSTYLPTTTAAVHGPRLDYDPVTHVAKGLLIEEARTNNCPVSEDFSSANWVKTGVTVTANSTTAPDGTTTADLITASAGTATIAQSLVQTAATNYVYSVFAKKGTSDWIYMTGQPVLAPKVWFNLTTGVVGTVEAGLNATGIQNCGNGWYRCWFYDIGDTGAEPLSVGLSDADNSTTVTVGRTAYLWGGQNETNVTFPTSYIPQPSGSGGVTRAADVAVMTGTNFSSWYNASAGTFVAEFDVLAASGTRGIVSADNAATTERIWLYGSGTDPKVAVTDGGAAQADIDVGTIAAGTTYKLGISFAVNDIAGCLNGGTVGTDTTATMPTPTQLRIGADATPNYLNGHLRRIQFWNIAVDDATLQIFTDPLINDLTVTGSQTTLATTQSGTITVTDAAAPGAGLVGTGAGGAYQLRPHKSSPRRRKRPDEPEPLPVEPVMDVPPLVPAPETIAMIAVVHEPPTRILEDDSEEEELLLLLLAS